MLQSPIITYCIAAVWLINGLFCKVFNLVPRHREIVATILGNQHAALFTTLIGISEILMAIWIISKFKFRENGVLQIGIILLMNCIEFIKAPDLLLWGNFNLIFAILFCVVIYFHQVTPKNS